MLDKKPKRNRTKGFVSIGIATILLVVACILFFNRQRVIDQINYWTFQPTAEIASFAEKSSMNEEGKFLFYSAHPSLQNREDFNKSCPSYSTTMAILGCYDGQKIYIYNITDPQLDGIREETAAYEMLHAAYKRLATDDRKKLDALIEKEYAKQRTEDTEASVDYFAKYEPGERDNELFSVIATQFRTIDPELEKYYARYFYDRQKLVDLYSKYAQVFTTIENKANALHDEINALDAQIKLDTADYDAKSAELKADVTAFNQQATSGNMTQYQYNSQKAALESRISALEAERDTINNEIATLNAKIDEYNAINVQFQKLNQSLNSTVSPAPSL